MIQSVTLSELSRITGLRLAGSDNAVSLPLTDSRSLLDPAETMFFAITTASGDGHRYIRSLYRSGVRSFVVDSQVFNRDDFPTDGAGYLLADRPVVEVLQLIAAHLRSQVTCPVVGITGSRGKTVVKEMLADACGDRLTVTSPRSWNSQTGVPLTIWRLEPDTELAIIEAGISREGEMERLERMIRPTLGIFTGLTDEHARGFDSPAQKMDEKALLFKECPDIVYVDNDPVIEPALRRVCPCARLHRAADYGSAVATARKLLGYKDSYMPHGVSDHVSTRIDISEGIDGNIIAYDGFTNDLGGIETALDRLSRRLPQDTPLVAVLGNLNRRGMSADEAYRRLERLLLGRRVDGIVAVGSEIGRYAASFSPMLKRRTAADAGDFMKRFTTYDFPRSALLIKGDSSFTAIKSWLEDSRHDTRLEVNLDALTSNFNYYRSLVKPTTAMVAMVKADAYGAGAVEVARTLQSQGADYLAVAVVEEGLALRRAGITMPVMVLNPITSNYTALFAHRLEPAVFSLRELAVLSRFAPRDNASSPYPVHVKLDTGMHRFGLNEQELPQFMEEIRKYPQLRIASVFSHLATADCLDMDDYTEYQLKTFDRMSSYITEHAGYPVLRHVLNTAGIMRYPEYQYDMVRLGIGLYGISPLDEHNPHLRPVSRLTTTISALQHRQPGETVGYSRRGRITAPSTIATLPIGYADGLNRHLGCGHASMMVNGTECPTVGNICMDICMIDVTGADAHCGDRVEIFGDLIPVSRVASALDTITYEVLTSVAPRVGRIYYRE